MSSILKALKKLRSEPSKQDETLSWPKEIDIKRAVRGDRKRSRLSGKLIYVVAALVLLTGTGWLIYSQKPLLVKRIFPWAVSSEKDQEGAKTGPAPTQRGTAAKLASKKRTPPLPRRRVSIRKQGTDKGRLPLKRPLTRKVRRKTGPDRRLARKPPTPFGDASRRGPIPIPRRQMAQTKPGRRPDRTVSSKDISQKKIPSRKPESDENSVDRAALYLEPADESKFKLQAIAWSSDPKKRIAVINDHVLKEGASVEGAEVTQIGKEVVVIRQGGKKYKLVFGLR